jgi:hypothetical protein
VRLRTLLLPVRERPGESGGGFDRYSVAAFGSGRPETVRSARRDCCVVRPGDVLVSRALEEPRRAWVVGPAAGRPQIATGEWLPLRSSAYDGAYLRHLLVSNEFHVRFAAAAGAARPTAQSAKLGALELPCPSLAQQGAIARRLDLVEALRAKRRQALHALDRLALGWPLPECIAAADSPHAREPQPLAELRGRMEACARQLDALLAVLRDRAFRAEKGDGTEEGDAPYPSGPGD